jgi:hypothetical protein
MFGGGCIGQYLKSGIIQTLMGDYEFLLIFALCLLHDLSLG